MPRTLDDIDDDLNLPQRGRRPDPREDLAREMSHDADREFTLSTGTVLVLFFTLALICAVFFGFGYSMGRKSVKPVETANVAVPDTATPSDETAAKPSAATPSAPIPSYQADPASAGHAAAPPKVTTSADGTRVTIATVPPPTKPAQNTASTGSASPAAKTLPVTPAPAVSQATPQLAASGDPAAVYVQIAAVSHQEDANVLLSALKRRGYSVFTRPNPGDKLIHVQVGPYSGKKDAEVMRQRLLGDGYNAILK